ncbi:MAG: hypothetical protein IJR35_05585 [Synergistaceae bacterium]|nr:hypothetical protein [Synergistaceae bacterium]MBQ9403863.1 hypothetical protein [Synergistaceae bacterium]MBQ9595316.1 hypothetical protein [Synergistaceae bacterium]MBR0205001.1 hypothetical protein [Synergistaceae bacterium]
MASKKKIIIGIICAILLLNVVWTVMQNKFTPKLEELKTQLQTSIASLEERITKIEQGGLPNVEDLKADFAKLREVADSFGQRVKDSVKTEEDQLAYLESQAEAQKAQVEAQKARVEALKKMAE